MIFNSGPNDRVFINFVDHGAPGLVAFPNDIVSSIISYLILNNDDIIAVIVSILIFLHSPIN